MKMQQIKHVLVGLDMTDMDETLIQFAGFVARRGTVEKVQFLSILKNQIVPAELKKQFPEMTNHAIKERKEKIREKLSVHFDAPKSVRKQISVRTGSLGTLLEMAIKGETDLIIIGQKKNIPGSGVLGTRLARRATCNLLIVPEGVQPNIRKVLVPVDFSKYSKLALETVVALSKLREKDVEIYAQNVYAVPAGYHYTGKTYEEFAEIMRKNAEKELQKLLSTVDVKGLNIIPICSMDVNDNLASDIYDLANEIKPDAIVIGAKGRSAAASLLLGSMAEKLVGSQMEFPLLIVRPKGETAGILETFRDIH